MQGTWLGMHEHTQGKPAARDVQHYAKHLQAASKTGRGGLQPSLAKDHRVSARFCWLN